MVRAAKDRGYAYVAITEHSKSLAMAGGFDEARVRRSVAEIAAVRREVPGIEVLHGLEVDILADGALDLDDDALELLDWVDRLAPLAAGPAGRGGDRARAQGARASRRCARWATRPGA